MGIRRECWESRLASAGNPLQICPPAPVTWKLGCILQKWYHGVVDEVCFKIVHFLRLRLVLGHSRLSTTGIYLTPSEEDLRSALGRAGL
jgi:hypothetical protein